MTEGPFVLALDTSHTKGSVAVTCGEEVRCEILFDAGDTHSATMMPAVDLCLRTAKVPLREIGLIGVVSGPGSFTGLRIGLSTAKAFAAVRGCPVVPVASLEVLAAAFPYTGAVFPLIDARRGEVYGALYNTEAGLPIEVVPPFSAEPGRVGAYLSGSGYDGPVVACGTGVQRYRESIEPLFPGGSCFPGPRWSVPSASLLALLALKREPVRPEELSGLEPLYIRPPDARPPGSTALRTGGDIR